jgi:hypothetical protein
MQPTCVTPREHVLKKINQVIFSLKPVNLVLKRRDKMAF